MGYFNIRPILSNPEGSSIESFNTLEELQQKYPDGTNTPVFVLADKSWYYWDKPELYSYLADNAIQNSTSDNWKGSPTLIKKNVKLTEVGAVGLPRVWQLWEVVNGNLGPSFLASGEFVNVQNDKDYYNTSKLTEPLPLNAGKTYILIVKYDAGSSYYTAEPGINDDYLQVTAAVYNTAIIPAAGYALRTTSVYAYKHYLKYEVV